MLDRSIYTLLNGRGIIRTAFEFRGDYGVPKDLAWHVLRFCAPDWSGARRNGSGSHSLPSVEADRLLPLRNGWNGSAA